MKVLFVTGVFENDANGAARFAKLVYDLGGSNFYIMSEDTLGGDRIIRISGKPKWYQRKLWQYFRIQHFKKELDSRKTDFDVFVFNNPILAYGFNTDKPCYTFVHDEKLMKVIMTFRFDFIRRHILRRFEKKVLESGIHVIANSRHIHHRILETYNVKKKNLSVLYQGIRLDDKFRAYEMDFSKRPIQILFVKNDFELGGLPDLITALGLLKKYQFHLNIVGTSPKVNKKLVRFANVSYSVRGILSNKEVIDLMYESHLLCIPARYEPLGVTIMEGLAVGIPTLTTGVGGLPEVTNDGKYVWECKPNDPRSIADQIEACLTNNDSLREEKSMQGKNFIHQKFDFRNVVSKLKSLLH
ncbi:MAG: glycosyltransferase family 4 protein [Bacteroidota bacterium]